jgi:N-methylhydantoinase A
MLRLGIDIGGTFTDFVVADDDGSVSLFKEPSTPDAPERAIADGLSALAAGRGETVADLLGATRLLVHGTTIATNQVIQRTGPALGLLCTEGFRDVLHYRDGFKPERFNVRFSPPRPFIGRELRLGVRERVDATGAVVTPLDEGSVRAAAAEFRARGIEGVAVAFLWSILRPDHEHRAAEIVREEMPGARVVCSADVLPEIREWERTSAAVLSAYVLPGVEAYLLRLRDELAAAGLARPPLIMQLNGGCAPIDEILARPVYVLHSGPAAAPAAAAAHAGRLGLRDVVSVDMGGTSFDVCLIRDGVGEASRSVTVEGQPVGVSAVEVHSVGAGGGSIASVDDGGALTVGPRSAGSVPGPAAYGAGGREPTVTDANIVLGYLVPEHFLGGRRTLRADLAREAVRCHVAEPLEMDLEQAAAGIVRIVNTNMVAAIRAVSVERGIDPRRLALVCGGGAGALHAGALAAELGIDRVVIPRQAGTFCAYGMTVTDVRHDLVAALHGTDRSIDRGRLTSTIASLEEDGRAKLRAQGFIPEQIELRRAVDARYRNQVHELTIPIAATTGSYSDADVAEIAGRFHAEHARLFEYAREDIEIEFLHWRITATGRLPVSGVAVHDAAGDAEVARLGWREAYLPATRTMVSFAVYDAERLPVGAELVGPAIAVGATTTILVADGDRLLRPDGECFVLHVGGAREPDAAGATTSVGAPEGTP